MLLQKIQALADDPRRERSFHSQVFELQEQTFAQTARRASGRVEALYPLKHTLHLARRGLQLLRQLVERGLEIAVVVEVVNNGCGDSLVRLAQAGQPKLPHKIVFERATTGRGILERAAMVVLGIRWCA